MLLFHTGDRRIAPDTLADYLGFYGDAVSFHNRFRCTSGVDASRESVDPSRESVDLSRESVASRLY